MCVGTHQMFIDLNYISITFSALHLAHPLSHPIMASFYISSSLRPLLFQLSLCVIIALHCLETLVIFMNQWTSRLTGNPVIWGKNWLSAVPLERSYPQKQINQPKPIYLECLFSVTLKFFQAAAPRRTFIHRLSQTAVSALSLITLYCPLYELQWHIIILNCLLSGNDDVLQMRKRVWLLIPVRL